MQNAVVKFGLRQPDQELRLSKAIHRFTRWRESELSSQDADTPGLIVKTCPAPSGGVQKTLIFDEPRWAEVFMTMWRTEITA